MTANVSQYVVKYLRHDLDSELILMRDYNITPDILFAIKVILLAKDGEYEYLKQFIEILTKERFRELLQYIQGTGVILKSWKIPKEGSRLDVEDIPFNQNFLKRYYRSAFEMGEELFYTYPQSCTVQGQVFNLKTVSKKFDSLEQAFQKYAKAISNKPEVHQQIIDDIKWGIENSYNFTTLDRFIIDRGWEALSAMKNGEGTNINLEATQLI